MADSGMIKTVFAGIIMVAILGYVVALIYPMLGTGGRDYDHSLTVENAGTDDVDIEVYDSVKGATTTITYTFSSAVELTLTLNDETVYENAAITGTGSIENDVASLIADGTNTILVEVDNVSRITSLSTTLDATTHEEYIGEKTQPLFTSYVPVIVTILLIGFFVAGVAMLLRYLGIV